MAYVLEYTSRHYQTKRSRRNAALVIAGVLAVVLVLVGIYISHESHKPTFHQIVNTGYVDKNGQHIESYQSMATRLFKLRRKWDAAKSRQEDLVPYLQQAWAAVPMTNLVSGVADALTSLPPELNLLEPQSLTITSEDVKSKWTGTDDSWIRGHVVTVIWSTRRDHEYVEVAPIVCGALSNLFASSSVPGIATNVVVVKTDFPKGNRGGQEVFSQYTFPTLHRFPVSKNLITVTDAMHAFHNEVVNIDIDPKNDAQGAIHTLKAAFDMGRPIKPETIAKRAMDFGDAIDPGYFIGLDMFSKNSAGVGKALEIWNAKTHGRYPWQRKASCKLLQSDNFYDPIKLSNFVAELPPASFIEESMTMFLEKCNGLTNAISNISLGEYDVDPFSPDNLHNTKNLLVEAMGTPILPTNRILRVVSGDSLVLSHPAKNTREGFYLPVSDSSFTNRYAFSEWTYTYSSTNSTIKLHDVADGLSAFVGCGLGYEPSEVIIPLQDSNASSIVVKGFIPVRLPIEEK